MSEIVAKRVEAGVNGLARFIANQRLLDERFAQAQRDFTNHVSRFKEVTQCQQAKSSAMSSAVFSSSLG
jgi:hypothetical protein